MNRIAVSAEEVPLPACCEKLKKFARKTLSVLNRENWDLSILLCDDNFIRGLNKTYRNRDMPTDVLSFELGENVIEDGNARFIAGDIVISLEALRENSKYFGVEEDEELRRLIVHGILHLDGRDHAENLPDTKEKSPDSMLELQEKILIALKDERIL